MALKDKMLPLSIVGKNDLIKMQRELSRLDDFFVASATRKAGEALKPPRISHGLELLARENQVNLLEAQKRKIFSQELSQILTVAPTMNISFSAEPPMKSLEVLIQWFRNNIHPQALLTVGIQPSIAAGCVLRTPNQIFDMSLRTNLKNEEPYLAKLIDGAANVR